MALGLNFLRFGSKLVHICTLTRINNNVLRLEFKNSEQTRACKKTVKNQPFWDFFSGRGNILIFFKEKQ
jgi:hypothetical protein